MPRILLITTSYPLTMDGSEAAGSFVKDFVSTLSQQCSVAVSYPSTESISNDIEENVLHYPFLVPTLPLSLLSPANPVNWLSIVKTFYSGWKSVEKAILQFNPDHILALWALPSGYWAKRAKECYGIPYSTWSLGSDIWTLEKIPVIKSLLRTVLKDASFCFADGYHLRDDVARIADRKVAFLPSSRILPITRNKKLRENPPYNLAFLGRWHTNKGVDTLLDALNLLEEEDWDKINKFRIAGGGPLESLVKKQVEKLQQAGRPVRLSGFLNTQEAAELLSWADYLVIPSKIESIPVVFSDALQTNTPMAVTPVGDFPDIFDKIAPGVIAENITKNGLVKAIRILLQTSPLDYSDNMSEMLNIFDMNNIVNSLISTITTEKE